MDVDNLESGVYLANVKGSGDSQIEKVIKLQPSHEEYSNPQTLRNIEQYKDRLGKNLYDCKYSLINCNRY